MSGNEAKLANAASIEAYGNVMRSKGLHARAQWAHEQARKIRVEVLNATIDRIDTRLAA